MTVVRFHDNSRHATVEERLNIRRVETSSVATTELIQVANFPKGVRKISLADPLDRNAMVEALRAQLRRALEDAYAEATVRALVIGGAGKNFSVGGDLSHIAEREAGLASYAMMKGVGEVALLVRNGAKPIVAAVAGHCIGAGAGLALLCDTIVMERSASIGLPYLRIGLVPDFGLSHTLAERIGYPAARQALLFAKTFKADDAAAAGLADELVGEGQAHALELATTLAAFPAHALGLVRQMLRDGGSTLEADLDREAAYQATCFGSADMQEGVAAFREKRKPDFVRDLIQYD
jgi:2-(1,2-epoxy-1,2-dihydrophenyl)acetyl-CoA isomerase